MKKYIANSEISVSVTLPNKKSTRISFSALSSGMSVFYTSDKDIQWALEHHYKFGKLFRLVEDTSDEKPTIAKKTGMEQVKSPAPKSVKKGAKKTENPVMPEEHITDETTDMIAEAEAGNEDSDDNNSCENDASEYREVVVSDMNDAKDYLAENFDVVRTKLKSVESIREAALSFGIIFKYL